MEVRLQNFQTARFHLQEIIMKSVKINNMLSIIFYFSLTVSLVCVFCSGWLMYDIKVLKILYKEVEASKGESEEVLNARLDLLKRIYEQL